MKGKKAVAKANSGGKSVRGDQNRSALRSDFYQSVAEILRAARANAYRAVNFAMVEAYWNVGRMIVEEEQQGKERAEYGAALLKNLSIRLTGEFGAGFDERELRRMRQFYLSSPIRGALRPELTWTHYRLLLRVEKPVLQTSLWVLDDAVVAQTPFLRSANTLKNRATLGSTGDPRSAVELASNDDRGSRQINLSLWTHTKAG